MGWHKKKTRLIWSMFKTELTYGLRTVYDFYFFDYMIKVLSNRKINSLQQITFFSKQRNYWTGTVVASTG